MCGIWYINQSNEKEMAKKAISQLKNRGPDYQAYWSDDNITMAQTRLAILDLDKRSNQPFITDNVVLNFNGEIYNYKELKLYYLNQYNFKTESDTEVITALYEVYGLSGLCVLNGMFAIILYDRRTGETYFYRDKYGIKPLYYIQEGEVIQAASLMKALQPQYNNYSINYSAINDILALGYPRVPIYNNMKEFKPGIIYDSKLREFTVEFIYQRDSFKDAISEQYITTDVPIGITLSGGIDSAYIAYIARQFDRVNTYTVGFSEDNEDVIKAREFSELYDTNHHEIIVDEEYINQEYDKALEYLDIPMDMGSTVYTHILAKEISKTNNKVILIGEGSDEINGGYSRHEKVLQPLDVQPQKWYEKRIQKFNYDERKDILGKHAYNVDISIPKTSLNEILYWDTYNELQYYHLKRIDHIVSEFGIEARVPYLDLYMKNYIDHIPFEQKVGKQILRNEAKNNGLDYKFYSRPKKALKLHSDMKCKIADNVVNFLNKKE